MASGIIFALIGAFLNVVKNPICFILWLDDFGLVDLSWNICLWVDDMVKKVGW